MGNTWSCVASAMNSPEMLPWVVLHHAYNNCQEWALHRQLMHSADSKCHKNDKKCFYPFDNWQGSEKASSPLNGYVAVFSIVGETPRWWLRQRTPSYASNTYFQPGGTIKQSMDILSSSTPHHGNVAQPNLAHLKVEHRQLSLQVDRT